MAWYRCIGSNGGGGGTALKAISYQYDNSGSAKTTYTTSAFSLASGDTILVAVMHRSTLTIPLGFSVIKQISNGAEGQQLTVMTYTAATAETKTVTLTQASSARMASFWIHLRGASVSDAGIDYTGTNTSAFTMSTPTRPYIVFLSNVYTGQWNVSNATDIVFYKDTTNKWLAMMLNFGSAVSQSYTLTPAGANYATIGVYLTAE